MTIERTIVTPEMASQMLERWDGIHPFPFKRRLAHLEQALKDGIFDLGPDPICLDSNGNLFNGQHRLWAIKETGISAELLIAYNVPRDIFDHRSRTK